MKYAIVGLLVRWAILAIGVAVSAAIVPGIGYETVPTLLVVVILLSFFNAFLKPLFVFFTFPFILLTLGIGVWLINAFLLLMAARVIDGFEVAGFGTALLGSLVVSLTNVVLSRLLVGREQRQRPQDEGVIDI